MLQPETWIWSLSLRGQGPKVSRHPPSTVVLKTVWTERTRDSPASYCSPLISFFNIYFFIMYIVFCLYACLLANCRQRVQMSKPRCYYTLKLNTTALKDVFLNFGSFLTLSSNNQEFKKVQSSKSHQKNVIRISSHSEDASKKSLPYFGSLLKVVHKLNSSASKFCWNMK